MRVPESRWIGWPASAIEREEAEVLRRVVLQERPRRKGSSICSLRTGSCRSPGPRALARLISIDPNQKRSFGNAGLETVRRARLEDRKHADREGEPAGAARNGLHTFEGTLLDFWYLDRLLRPGGVVGFSDCNLPAVDRVIGFVHTHRRYEELDVDEFLPSHVRRFLPPLLPQDRAVRAGVDFRAPF